MALCRSSAKSEDMVVPPSTSEEREQLALFCKALAHPARIQIVQFLAGVETCFCGVLST